MTITIKATAVQPGNIQLPPDSIENTAIRAVLYQDSTGDNKMVQLPDPNPTTFIPLNQVTDEVIIGWISTITGNV
jgi:hypothetical protein